MVVVVVRGVCVLCGVCVVCAAHPPTHGRKNRMSKNVRNDARFVINRNLRASTRALCLIICVSVVSSLLHFVLQ